MKANKVIQRYINEIKKVVNPIKGTTSEYHFKYRMLVAIIAFIVAVLLTYPLNLSLIARGLSIFIAVITLSVPSLYHYKIEGGNLKKYFLYLSVWDESLSNIKSILAVERIDIDKPTIVQIGKVDSNVYYLVLGDGRKIKIGNRYYVNTHKQSIIEALQKLTRKKIERQKKYIIFQ
ncbi:hypothetical protein ACFQ0C_26365 [Paenibacillus sp. GCM10027630]